jgi:hypothetical protein
MRDCNLKKCCWHPVVLKLFIICFCSSTKATQRLEELKLFIECEIFAIPSSILQGVVLNFGMRLCKTVKVEVKHTEYNVI